MLAGPTQAGDHRRYGGKHSSKLYGVIETMPGNGHEGIWVIGGNEVNVLTNTKIKEKYGTAAAGSYVEVIGTNVK